MKDNSQTHWGTHKTPRGGWRHYASHGILPQHLNTLFTNKLKNLETSNEEFKIKSMGKKVPTRALNVVHPLCLPCKRACPVHDPKKRQNHPSQSWRCNAPTGNKMHYTQPRFENKINKLALQTVFYTFFKIFSLAL